MANIKKLQPGQVVWEIRRHRAGNTMVRTQPLYSLNIVEVDLADGRVFASWNSNPPKWYRERDIKSWQAEKPVKVSKSYSFADRYVTAAKWRKMQKEAGASAADTSTGN